MSAAALTALIGFASFAHNRWFVLLAIAVYILPPIFLYLTAEGENVPSVVGDDTTDTTEHESSDGRETDDATTGRDFETESHAESIDEADTEPDFAGGNGSRTAESDETATTGDEHPPEQSGASETDRRSESDSTEETDSSTESAIEEVSTDEPDSEPTDVEPGWNEADTPTEESLLDVVSTQNCAFAVGENGVALARNDDEWSVALEDGPTANANSLRGVDCTEDGQRVWFVGDSGVLGRYENGTLTDHSAPKDQTSTWADVAVTGETGDERIHLVNGSGELLRGTYDVGSVSWGDIEKPGSGSSIAAIEFVDTDRGHICDTNQSVYETTDGGETYEKIGIEDANATFTSVAATDSMVVVAGDDGSVFRYDGSVWTPLSASESALSAIDLGNETGLAAGDGGAIYELTDGSWESVETPVDTDFGGVVLGGADGSPDIAVGAGGTVIERRK